MFCHRLNQLNGMPISTFNKMNLDSQAVKLFLNQNNITDFQIDKVAGDASFRSYWRVTSGQNSWILMFAPPTLESIDHFIKIDKILINYNFRAPKIFAENHQEGFLLLEDFGNKTLANFLKENLELELTFYKKACDIIIKLSKTQFDLQNYNFPSYNNFLLTKEVMVFADWYLPYISKRLTLQEISNYKSLWIKALDRIPIKEPVPVLRDYHSENLMVTNQDEEMGILDFQDAVIGHSAYDLVSLLEDARRDVNPEVVNECYNYFIKNSGVNPESFYQEYQTLSLQRNLKILGVFARLANRDNKKSYLDLIPRVLNLVKNRIDHILNSEVDNHSNLKDISLIVNNMI